MRVRKCVFSNGPFKVHPCVCICCMRVCVCVCVTMNVSRGYEETQCRLATSAIEDTRTRTCVNAYVHTNARVTLVRIHGMHCVRSCVRHMC